MTTFTAEQVGMVAWNAGFGRDEPTLARAVAVALAESHGDTAAHNDDASTGDDSYGLWQINMLGEMGPARRKQFDIKSNAELLDPQKNANAAWEISGSGRNWTPWSTFKSNAYLKHMPTGQAVAKKLIARAGKNREGFIFKLPFVEGVANARDAAGEKVAEVSGVPAAIQAGINGFTQSLFKMGLNAGVLAVALVLMILGVVILLRSPIKKVAVGTAKVATAVVPGGKVATVAGKAAKVL